MKLQSLCNLHLTTSQRVEAPLLIGKKEGQTGTSTRSQRNAQTQLRKRPATQISGHRDLTTDTSK